MRLEDVLTDRQILDVDNQTPGFCETVRACIALAVEKCEKVSGFVTTTRASGLVHDGHAAGWFFVDPKDPAAGDPGTFRHALLLLGPKYEPKPVETTEQKLGRYTALLAKHHEDSGWACDCHHDTDPVVVAVRASKPVKSAERRRGSRRRKKYTATSASCAGRVDDVYTDGKLRCVVDSCGACAGCDVRCCSRNRHHAS